MKTYTVRNAVYMVDKTFISRSKETFKLVWESDGDGYIARNVPEWVAQNLSRSEFITIEPESGKKTKQPVESQSQEDGDTGPKKRGRKPKVDEQ